MYSPFLSALLGRSLWLLQHDWCLCGLGNWTKFRMEWGKRKTKYLANTHRNNQPVIPDEGPIQTFLTSEPLMHEQVRCFTEKLGKAHFDVDQKRNWRISYSVWLGRGNQKVFPRNAYEMAPGFRKSKNCTPISTLELLQGYLGLSLCHHISFPTSVLIPQDTQKSSEAVFGANLN